MPDYNAEIKEIEDEIKKTQYNKATQHHIGLLKAKIARLRERQESRSGGGKKEGYHVRKTGDGTVVLLGFPSTGKSTLLNRLCRTESETGAYAFTTVSIIPGTLVHKHARIQILDVPGIVEGASSGKGRGKEVLSCLRSADLVLLVADITRPEELEVIEKEAQNAGIRLNARRPDVQVTRTSTGGVNVLSTVRLTELDDETIRDVLKEFKMPNADVVIRQNISVDELIDCVEDNKRYVPGVTVMNKKDLATHQRITSVRRKYSPDLFVSAQTGENIEELRDLIHDRLELMSIYLKEPGNDADMDEPLILPKRASIHRLCEKLHKDFVSKFKFARVWGPSAKFDGQKLMLHHKLEEGDVVEIHLA